MGKMKELRQELDELPDQDHPESESRTNLPTLFKKTSTGKIQFWTIFVSENPSHSKAFDIHTTYGQVDGKTQHTVDTIFEGKNIGKKNETNPEQQAIFEAKAKHEKQLKKGYVYTPEDAAKEEVNEIIEGGVLPMLAHKFTDHASKIKYPSFIQPKLDGTRAICIIKNGKATLWSRTRKQITSCPHIIKEVEEAFKNKDVILDGELYVHELKNDFEKIISLVRQEEPGAGHEMIQYHVYDMISDEPFKYRYAKINSFFRYFEFQTLRMVQTEVVKSEHDVVDYFDKYRSLGYEGAMLRNIDSLYVNKRSYDLQKVKEFEDAEFNIVGIEEGRGKLAGHAIFVCKTDKNQEFKVKMDGDTERLKDFFNNHSLWKNKKLTVRYQGFTSYGIPRFPVGKAIRDYE